MNDRNVEQNVNFANSYRMPADQRKQRLNSEVLGPVRGAAEPEPEPEPPMPEQPVSDQPQTGPKETEQG